MSYLKWQLSSDPKLINNLQEESISNAFQILTEVLVEMKKSSKINDEEFKLLSELVISTYKTRS